MYQLTGPRVVILKEVEVRLEIAREDTIPWYGRSDTRERGSLLLTPTFTVYSCTAALSTAKLRNRHARCDGVHLIHIHAGLERACSFRDMLKQWRVAPLRVVLVQQGLR